jgi:hypothetical protein
MMVLTPEINAARSQRLHAVIPAKAGIQTMLAEPPLAKASPSQRLS